jgi:hypothetical protein
MGRFLIVDPQLDPGTPAQFNAYVYSGNNPVTYSDPSGLSWFSKAASAVGGFVKKHQAEIVGGVAGVGPPGPLSQQRERFLACA